jgi:protein-tyrosine phosphatase
MKLCDLHTHVLPGMDDGAPTIEYALQMIRNAAASDVELLAVTPHCNRPGELHNYLDGSLVDCFAQLQQAAKDIPVRLVLGSEAFVDEFLPQLLRRKKIPTINGSRYLLTEFPADASPDFIQSMLQNILELGYVPMVAHPERYISVCQMPQIVVPWLDMGCHLQLTGGSIIGEYGKTVQHTATYLLQQDLVACVASDAHGLHHRSNFLLDVYDHLSLRYSKHYAGCLMYENPMGICCDNDI